MIVCEKKQFNEILKMIGAHTKILILGCGTCVTVCFAGGEKEVGILSEMLKIHYKKENKTINIIENTIERQCDKEFLEPIKDVAKTVDVILSMGCGAGVQRIAEEIQDKQILPAVNTKFIGATEQIGIWNEKCVACGDCILDKTAGICPIARCSKSLLNGPCGGSQNSKCEVDKEQDCAWQLIYDRLKSMKKLDVLEEIFQHRDWSNSAHGGVRRIIREDLVIDETIKKK